MAPLKEVVLPKSLVAREEPIASRIALAALWEAAPALWEEVPMANPPVILAIALAPSILAPLLAILAAQLMAAVAQDVILKALYSSMLLPHASWVNAALMVIAERSIPELQPPQVELSLLCCAFIRSRRDDGMLHLILSCIYTLPALHCAARVQGRHPRPPV